MSAVSDQFKRYHLGCGRTILEDFLNIDGQFDWLEAKLQEGAAYPVTQIPSAAIMKHDLSKGIPAPDGSLKVVYHCHFLEHLQNPDGKNILLECYRSLAPGGRMRIAVPDFELWCKNYIEKKDEFFQWYKDTYLTPVKQYYRTNGEIFTGMIYNWGHCMAYDRETLTKILEEIGFVEIRTMGWGESKCLDDIAKIETADNQRKFESLIIECTKGHFLK